MRTKVLVAAVWGGAFSVLTSADILATDRTVEVRWILAATWFFLFLIYVALALTARRSSNLPEESAFVVGRPLSIGLSLVLCGLFGPVGLFYFALAFAIPCVLLASIRDSRNDHTSDVVSTDGGTT